MTPITEVLRQYDDGEITWDEALAALSAAPMATKLGVSPPKDSGADFARWWHEVEDQPFPVEGTYDEVVAAVNRGWITTDQAQEVGRAQAALAMSPRPEPDDDIIVIYDTFDPDNPPLLPPDPEGSEADRAAARAALARFWPPPEIAPRADSRPEGSL